MPSTIKKFPCENDLTFHQRWLSRVRDKAGGDTIGIRSLLGNTKPLPSPKPKQIITHMLYNMVENRPLTVVSELKVLINLTKVLERSWKSPYFWSAQRCGNHVWMVQSICLSVWLSIRPSVLLSHHFHYVPFIISSWNFQELLSMTKSMSMEKSKGRSQSLRMPRSKPNLAFS